MPKVSTIAEMDLAGGAVCLDFVNTALDLDESVERLHRYADLLILARRLSLLDADTLAALEQLADDNPEHAERVLLKARQVRQSMLTVFSALVNGGLGKVTASEMKAFNKLINEAMAERGFHRQVSKLAVSWLHPQTDLQQVIWIFSLSAYELLTTQDQNLVKQCGGCAWFFLDTTKNHRRKWCTMEACGTHQKARRYYQRKKQV
ncbi:hypothetical protein GCM10027347_60650 [Larkinella harenae]